MPYYLCKNEAGLSIETSWPRAKAKVHKQAASWVKRYELKTEAHAALINLSPNVEVLAASHGVRPRVYVDGSAVLGAWSACAVYFAEGDSRNDVRLLAAPHTSPRAELAAVLLCLDKGAVNCDVFSDSAFVCQAFERGWPPAFAHQDLMRSIRAVWPTRNLRICKVAGHSGEPGNEAVDAMLAVVRSERQT
jgi:ribonuclease HI